MSATLTMPDIDIDELRHCCKAAQSAVDRNQETSVDALRMQRRAGQMLSTVTLGTGRPSRNGNRVTLSDLGVTKMQASRWRLLATISDADFEQHLAARVTGGRELTTAGALKFAKRLLAQQDRETMGQASGSASGIHVGDFRELGDMVADESAGLIFTDPPYLDDTIHLYGDLAEFADRVLMPGGMLVAYCGHYFLPRVFADIAARSSLTWGHCFAAVHRNGGGRVHRLNLRNGWKPLLCYFKEPLSIAWELVADTVQGGKEKSLHDWQQAESEAAHFIEAFAPVGSLVVDPFCGSGTTLVAAQKLGRRWLGFEIDPGHAATARGRLNQ